LIRDEKVGSSLKIKGSLSRYSHGDRMFGVRDDKEQSQNEPLPGNVSFVIDSSK